MADRATPTREPLSGDLAFVVDQLRRLYPDEVRHIETQALRAVVGDSIDDCVFCRIVAEVEPATFVRRWTDAVAIRPLDPVTDGHVLVIPRQHVVDATDKPYVAAETMQRAASFATPPCNIITSAGPEASQTVRHLHIHVIPRRSGDGLALPWTKPAPAVTNLVVITGPSADNTRAAGFAAGLQIGYQEGRRRG